MANEIILVVTLTFMIFGVVLGKPFPGQHASATLQVNNNGQIFNCVDFYKQPAFANSSLDVQDNSKIKNLQQQETPNEIGLKTYGCPLGMVPILKVVDSNVRDYSLQRSNGDVYCSAKVQTRANDPNKKFLGAHAMLSVYKPPVEGGQWSASRIKLLNGDESIETGWMINPNYFKDNEAHFYATFIVGGKKCIDLDCSGFRQVSGALPVGTAASQYSDIAGGGDKLVGWNVTIEKHNDDGHWWLSLTSNNQQRPIGYWPKELFKNLAGVANQVEFGGETFNPSGSDHVPGMGNGYFARSSTRKSACFMHATIVDENFNHVSPQDTEEYQNCNLLYTVLDGGYQSEPTGRIIFYGGPLDQTV